jgi:hypothetical protein
MLIPFTTDFQPTTLEGAEVVTSVSTLVFVVFANHLVSAVHCK